MFFVFLSWLCCSGGYEPTSFSANLLGCCQLCSGAVQKYQVALGLIRTLLVDLDLNFRREVNCF